MNTLAKEILRKYLPAIFGDEEDEKILAAMDEYAKAYAPVPSNKAVQQAAKEYATDITKPDDLLLDEKVYTPAVVYMAAEMGFLAGASFNKDAVELDIDGLLNWADKNDWVWSKGQWHKYSWETRSSKELYNLFLADKNKNLIQQAHDNASYE